MVVRFHPAADINEHAWMKVRAQFIGLQAEGVIGHEGLIVYNVLGV